MRFALVLLAACGSSSEIPSPDAVVPFTPVTCDGSPLALYGMDNLSAQPVYGPVAVDTAGITICLSLDARDNLREAHFMSGTPNESGDMSSFELSLRDANDVELVAGWDVSIGNTDTKTAANLEYSFAPGQVYAAKLVVRAKPGRTPPATTQVGLSLFEPYE